MLFFRTSSESKTTLEDFSESRRFFVILFIGICQGKSAQRHNFYFQFDISTIWFILTRENFRNFMFKCAAWALNNVIKMHTWYLSSLLTSTTFKNDEMLYIFQGKNICKIQLGAVIALFLTVIKLHCRADYWHMNVNVCKYVLFMYDFLFCLLKFICDQLTIELTI